MGHDSQKGYPAEKKRPPSLEQQGLYHDAHSRDISDDMTASSPVLDFPSTYTEEETPESWDYGGGHNWNAPHLNQDGDYETQF